MNPVGCSSPGCGSDRGNQRPEDASYVTDGSAVAVRSPSGELLWLATGSTARCHPGSGEQAAEHDANAGFLLPERYGQATPAVVSVADLCDWLDATIVDVALGRVVIRSTTWELLQVHLDQAHRIARLHDNLDQPLLQVDYAEYDADARAWFTTAEHAEPFGQPVTAV
ncbi:MAG: hypothetical protein ACRCYU_00495 [Nocardioides sp.]